MITRRLHFCAAHRLSVSEWSSEKNAEIFGGCANPNWHGHNYELEVTVTGRVDPVTGMVMNLVELDRILQAEIVSRFDHRFINHEFDCFVNIGIKGNKILVG